MKKLKKLVSSILITMLTVATLGSISAVKAASAGPLYLGIVSLRRAGYGYQQEGSKVWKIAEYDSENGKTADLSKTIYCIKGGPGFGSSDMATGGVPTISKYTQKFNLKDLASIPSTYSKILPTGSNYNSLMWLLDNIYIMPAIGTDNTTAREEFLKSKIPNELYDLITDDDIDAVQQLAIWYFTNPSGDKYHYETSNFKINSIANVDSNYASMGDIFGDDGWDREDAIEALFQYYITNAKANSNYKSTNNTTSPIEIVKSNATMTKVGSNYVAGPYKINQLLNVDYTLNATFTDINGTTITPSIGIKDVSGNVTATTKTLKELVGQEFYLIMPTSSNISGIKMTVNTSYTSKTVDYWSVADAPNTEQPVVVVYETPQNFEESASIVVPKPFDLSLRKFITNINGTEITNRIPQVDVSKLASGEATTATYNHPKTPLKVAIGDVVTYTIRVYNEGDIDGYVEEITDHLPDQLEFVARNETNTKYGWTVDSTDSKVIKTSYLCKANEKVAGENKIPAFDGTTLSYKEVKVACKVVSTDPMPSKITNLADISDFTDGEGNKVTDRDSKEDNVKIPEDRPGYKDDESKKDYVPGQEDDDDFEKVTLVKFDLSLRKFITAVNNTEITSRIPQVDVTPIKDGSSTTAKYDHPKDPVLVSNGNIVTYTIRVFNEGEMDGYASEIKDDMPQGLKFLTDNKTNIEYRWKMLDKDGKETENLDEAVSIVTDYLSKEQEKTAGANLLKAFDGEKLDYRDVKVAFEVTEPNTSDRILINQAQISKDSDKDGNDVTDQDSVPDKWNEGEDDQDIEKVKVQYFDLSLRKWVTQAIVTENGEEKIIESGHKAEDDPEDVVKVDLKKSKINKVTIKFRYKIRVKNEGNIAGYAKELKDYIPNGLKFVPEDNPLWKQIDEKTITTDQTKDILLQPGDTTEVEVVLTWINDSENFGVMDNWAEISKDYNEYGSPDIDSTPDNNKHGEDDIDDAPVMIAVQTGETMIYAFTSLGVLTILASGLILIKKFVL